LDLKVAASFIEEYLNKCFIDLVVLADLVKAAKKMIVFHS